MRAAWYLHRRFVLVAGGMLCGLLMLLAVIAVATRGTQHRARADRPAPGSSSTARPGPAETEQPPTVAASDVAYWNALTPVAAAASPAFPAIDHTAAGDPTLYARAFVSELFTRDYRHATREQLIAWAQYEDAPLRSPDYPQSDWSKVLVDSLSDLTWDGALDTPIPGPGAWLALRSQQACQSVTGVTVSTDTPFEQQVAAGYQPPDPLTTVRDVALTVVQHTVVAGHPVVSRFSVSLQLQLGSSPRHTGYAMAVTNNYVIKAGG